MRSVSGSRLGRLELLDGRPGPVAIFVVQAQPLDSLGDSSVGRASCRRTAVHQRRHLADVFLVLPVLFLDRADLSATEDTVPERVLVFLFSLGVRVIVERFEDFADGRVEVGSEAGRFDAGAEKFGVRDFVERVRRQDVVRHLERRLLRRCCSGRGRRGLVPRERCFRQLESASPVLCLAFALAVFRVGRFDEERVSDCTLLVPVGVSADGPQVLQIVIVVGVVVKDTVRGCVTLGELGILCLGRKVVDRHSEVAGFGCGIGRRAVSAVLLRGKCDCRVSPLRSTFCKSVERKLTLFDLLSTSLRTRSLAVGSLIKGSRCDRWTSV